MNKTLEGLTAKPVVQWTTLFSLLGLLATVIVASISISHGLSVHEKNLLEHLSGVKTDLAVVSNEVSSLRNYAASMDANLKAMALRVENRPTKEQIELMIEARIEAGLREIREKVTRLESGGGN